VQELQNIKHKIRKPFEKKRHRLFTTLLTFIVVFNAQHIYASTHCRGAPEEMAEQNRQQRKKISK